MVLAPMALARGDDFQGTVAMLVVLPLLESGHPLTGLLQGIERLVRKAWRYFTVLNSDPE